MKSRLPPTAASTDAQGMDGSLHGATAPIGRGLRDPRVHLIVNPAAGGGRVASHQLEILDALRSRFGDTFRWSTTWGSGAATTLAHQAALTGVGLIVSAGGDGTLHEVANGVLGAGKGDSALGLLDVATESGFAESLGLPTRLSDQMRVLESGRANAVDVGRLVCRGRRGQVVGRFFVSECQIGLGAQLCSGLHGVEQPPGGRVRFCWHTLRTGLFGHATRMEIGVDDREPVTVELLGVVIANGPRCGSGVRFGAEARLDDGRLEVLLLHDVSRPARPLLLRRTFRGATLQGPSATYLPARRITVRTSRPVDVAADGEAIGTTPCGIQVRQGALTVVR